MPVNVYVVFLLEAMY